MTVAHTDGPRMPTWLNNVRPLEHERLRLFCFPLAGGSTSLFQSWQGFHPLVQVAPVEFPGRASRFNELPHRRLEPLVQEVAKALTPFLDKPFAFFGHSMGALVAFELTRFLERTRAISPRCLYISGRRPPQLAEPPRRLRYDLPEQEFRGEIRGIGGIPRDFLDNASTMDMLVPIFRADLELVQTYRYAGGPLIRCPISVFSGTEDPDAGPDSGAAWRELTSGPFSIHPIPGDHFFILQSRKALLDALSREISRGGVLGVAQ